jgi:hypothetical protein
LRRRKSEKQWLSKTAAAKTTDKKRGRPAKCPYCKNGKKDYHIEPCGHEVCQTCAEK